MLENMWRGVLINYQFLVSHALQVMFILSLMFALVLFKVLAKIRIQQKQSYAQLLEQQQQVENIQYRISRVNHICYEHRDKQRFISNQLSRMDDSIYELEEQITSLKEGLQRQPFSEYFEPKILEQEEVEL